MSIIDFKVYSDNCLNIFFILLIICLIVFTLKNFLDYLCDCYIEKNILVIILIKLNLIEEKLTNLYCV